MMKIPGNDWWLQYQNLRFLDGGRAGNLVDCHGLAMLIYRDHLSIDLPEWPEVTLDVLTRADTDLLSNRFSNGFKAVATGFEQAFDMAVIRRALPVDGKLKRGWWHLGVVTREGHLVHIDYHAGVVEVPFRDTTASRGSSTLRVNDVRLFRHESLIDAAEIQAMAAPELRDCA